MTTEIIDADTNANSLWGQPDPSGLDKSTREPSTPTASTLVRRDIPDANEAQIWDLESLVNDYADNSITATLWIYGGGAGETLQASLKLGGSFASDQSIVLATSSAWYSKVFGTTNSPSDFSGAQVRLTSSGGFFAITFAAIYVHVSGIIASGTGTGTAAATGLVSKVRGLTGSQLVNGGLVGE